MAKISVNNTDITIIAVNGNDYISLTDLARHKSDDPNTVIANWLRNRNTIEYLGIWEQLYNPDFKPTEFEGFRLQAGLNAFTLSPKKWTEATNAIGIMAKSGRYGAMSILTSKGIYATTPQSTSLFAFEYGKPQCGFHRAGNDAERSPCETESDSYPSDERVGMRRQR